MKPIRLVAAMLLLAAVGVLASAPQRQMSPLGLLPASYAGELPGAGGPVRWQLDLLPMSRYQLRLNYPGRPQPNTFDHIGRFSLEGRRIGLRGGSDGPVWLDLLDDGSLRKLDQAGRAIRSAQNDRLERLPAAALIEPRLKLAGRFVYFADAPRIELCADGRSLPVQQAADYLALERAYLAARPAPGAPLWVELEALIAPRPSMEAGQPQQPTLVVERFGRVDANGRCAP
jgi:copper homeostasis protein (lipoprotein)